VRRSLGLALVLTAVLAGQAVLPASSDADTTSTLTVVGTSDVFDSNLVQSVLKPGFEAAYPQYTLNYVSKGTGAAIAYAKAGTASALLVHAASLENQFVADGYSAEPYGRAIFWGDYVLLGPATDPAGVLNGSTHDIVGAFEKIAAAGAAGHANFVSRGGTPGTTVQEHAIWALTQGVSTCTVSSTNGGGTVPSSTTNPDGSCPATATSPTWYQTTNLTQGPNIEAGDVCNFAGGGCYVFTDRGTFQYLKSTNAISNLQIVTRDNDAASPGGSTLLVNSFHAYAVNPAKFVGNTNVSINLPAAQAFLDWVTSSAAQTAVGQYLGAQGDPPFLPDAAPSLQVTPVAGSIVGADTIHVTGHLANVVPGTPALSGVPVHLLARPAGELFALPTVVATGTTDSSGDFSIAYAPKQSYVYAVSTDALSKIENASLSPVFGDELASAQTAAGSVGVRSILQLLRVNGSNRRVQVIGRILPGAVPGAVLRLYAVRVQNLARGLHYVAGRPASGTTFNNVFYLGRGVWRIQLRYLNPGRVASSVSATVRVALP
jgi:tungstate transport system substrate-binding protein